MTDLSYSYCNVVLCMVMCSNVVVRVISFLCYSTASHMATAFVYHLNI